MTQADAMHECPWHAARERFGPHAADQVQKHNGTDQKEKHATYPSVVRPRPLLKLGK
jgi:hypothetical protein